MLLAERTTEPGLDMACDSELHLVALPPWPWLRLGLRCASVASRQVAEAAERAAAAAGCCQSYIALPPLRVQPPLSVCFCRFGGHAAAYDAESETRGERTTRDGERRTDARSER